MNTTHHPTPSELNVESVELQIRVRFAAESLRRGSPVRKWCEEWLVNPDSVSVIVLSQFLDAAVSGYIVRLPLNVAKACSTFTHGPIIASGISQSEARAPEQRFCQNDHTT